VCLAFSVTAHRPVAKSSLYSAETESCVPRLTSNLSKAHETRDSLSSSCLPIVLVHFQPFRPNSPLMRCALQGRTAAENRKKTFKSPISGLKVIKVIDVINAKKLVTGACYDKQHVYVYQQLFYAKQANVGETTTFYMNTLF